MGVCFSSTEQQNNITKIENNITKKQNITKKNTKSKVNLLLEDTKYLSTKITKNNIISFTNEISPNEEVKSTIYKPDLNLSLETPETVFNFNTKNNNHLNRNLDSINFIIATDLDNTLLGEIKDIETFNKVFLTNYSKECLLVYITGRSEELFNKALELYPNLLTPDILVTKDGSSIYWFNQNLANNNSIIKKNNDGITIKEDTGWAGELLYKWDQNLMEKLHSDFRGENVSFIKEKRQEIEMFRVYLYLISRSKAQEFINFIKGKTINNKSIKFANSICEYKNGFYGTITPVNSGKGNAIKYLSKKLKIKLRYFMVFGDSGNDISMLGINNIKACIVKNATQKLLEFYQNNKTILNIYLCNQQKTLGVLEGIKYWFNTFEK